MNPPFAPGLILIACSCCTSLAAAETMGWRGDGDGLFLDERPPLQWHAGSVPEGEKGDVRWRPEGQPASIRFRVPLPSPQSSSSIVIDGKVIVAADPDLVLAFDADSGKELWSARVSAAEGMPAAQRDAWRQKFDEAYRIQGQPDRYDLTYAGCGPLGVQKNEAIPVQDKERYAAIMRECKDRFGLSDGFGYREVGWMMPTPVGDGEAVYVKSGTGVIGSVSLDGTLRWLAAFQAETFGHNPLLDVSSPLLVGDLVISTWTPSQRQTGETTVANESLVAFDRRSGKQAWRATEWCRTAGWLCATPVHLRVNDTDLIVTGGGGVFRASDGKLLARQTGWSGSGSSPVAVGDTVYFIDCQSHSMGKPKDKLNAKGARLIATRYSLKGDALAWEHRFVTDLEKGERHMPSPLVVGGLVYLFKTDDWCYVVDAQTGEKKHSAGFKDRHLQKGWSYPSPIFANERILLFRPQGACAVFTPGPQPSIERVNLIEDQVFSSPVAAGDKLYVRGMRHLWCIGR